jgi:hypothetical protein
MYKLFSSESPVPQGVVTASGWKYVRAGLKQNLGTVLSYYRKNPTAVVNHHFLVRLMHSINIPLSHNLERYYANVDAVSLNTARALKMTSSVSKGEVFDGVFYGKDCPEILIAHTDYFDIFEANRNWQNVCPVRALSHPISDTGINIPDGRTTGVESGMAVIAINIPMLMVQYRAFRRNEWMERGQYGESELSMAHFVRMYVLPNMLFSHLDVVLFNRISFMAKGAPLGYNKVKHPFHLIDYDDKIVTVHTKILKDFVQNYRDFVTIMRTVPMATKENMEELMHLPGMAATRQVDWALTICRLSAISFLFRASKGGPGTRNRTEVNQIVKSIQRYESDRIMEQMLPLEYYLEVQSQIDAIKSQTI